MEQDYLPNRRGRRGLAWLFALLGLAFLASAVYCLFFGLNRFSLEIELLGGDTANVEFGQTYREPGYRVVLRGSRLLTEGLAVKAQTQVYGKVNEDKLGRYSLEYQAVWLGLEASAVRTVQLVDSVSPVITLTPDAPDLQPAPEYQEAGYAAFDNYDGDITDRVIRTVEEGRVLYCVTDSAGNTVSAERAIPVFTDYPPELHLLGEARMTLALGEEFIDPGYAAMDRRDGDLTASVSVSIDHPFVRYLPDTYQLTYRVTDSDGHETVAYRTLTTLPGQRPETVYPEEKTIYLTFDDGPGPDTARLLHVLKRYDAHATFFVVDTGYPELLQRIVREGHSIGIHTCTHRYQQIYSSPEAYFQDAFAMQQIIRDATGVQTWLLRFPGGSSNTISRKSRGIMTYLTQAVESCGFSYFDWNVDSNDAGGAKTSAQVYQNVVDGIGSNPYCVVLQHDIHSFSVDAVERILQWGQQNGYQFLPLQTDSPVIHHPVLN